MVFLSTRAIFLFTVFCLVLVQTAYADIFSQLQFIKISLPKSGQDVVADNVSAGKALKLNVNFHKRTGNAKQQKIAVIHKSCPVGAKDNKYVTYTKKWTIPKNTKPGSYAVDFVELVQLRRGQMTVTETVKVNVVD
ncbi:hypothetical protein INT48_004460 [Thamnidium elegans]|uniref:Uncharacterized protein n=1 Tax=Thamnidium elegans TaxID=101142 RepID=A0A8H7SJH9_9FUNG|nr:hypothetical protein INT48_004460 [Thamnidium elegans]